MMMSLIFIVAFSNLFASAFFKIGSFTPFTSRKFHNNNLHYLVNPEKDPEHFDLTKTGEPVALGLTDLKETDTLDSTTNTGKLMKDDVANAIGNGAPETINGCNLAWRIEDYFNTHMKNSNVPLFKDFTTYSRSLPVRFFQDDDKNKPPEFISLFELDYYVRPQDLTEMSSKIITNERISRQEVKYIAAPTKSGKTASVLPAFLRGTTMENGGTHYIYFAFFNNNERSFACDPYIPSHDPKEAEKQGAAFIVECVKTIFENPDSTDCYKIKLEKSPNSVEYYSKILSTYLTEKLGQNYSIWCHLDEHAKMCDRLDLEGKGADFSKGAMKALALAKGATVIASYTARPALPVDKQSDACRMPIALPSIDINQVMATVPELAFDTSNFDSTQKLLLASLKVRLGFKLKEIDMISILHRRGTSKVAEIFLNAVAAAKVDIKINATNSLKQCNRECKYNPVKINPLESDNAATKLLLGFIDSDTPESKLYVDVVSLPDDRITTSIPRMLETYDPKIQVYSSGRDLFYDFLLDDPDLVSGSPLEAAYCWTLSCRSAFSHQLEIAPGKKINIDCAKLLPGHLFSDTDSSKYNLDFLEKDTIYYTDERVSGNPTHPLADIFFITNDNELVLIDVFGGQSSKLLLSKRKKLVAWIKAERSKIQQYKLRCVILAPNINISSSLSGDVIMVTGKDAVNLLGGLKQIVQWL